MDKENLFHDHGYKYLFSHPTMVRYLLTSFVEDEWIKEIDFTKMEKLDKEFIDEEYQRRESDIIYKIGYRESEAYLFLLIEFQSRVDRFMALRVLHYLCKFYLDIMERKKYKFLPPVFPIVLYNGDERWTAPVEFMDLIDRGGGKGLEAYIPKFRYYKIAENEFSREWLMKVNNLTSALFYLENTPGQEIEQAINQIIEIVILEQDKAAVNKFITWIRNMARRKQLKDDRGEDYTVYNPSEVKNMLAATLDKLREKAREEGMQRGMQEGKQEGIKEGRQEGRQGIIALIRAYLISRFGKAPEEFLEKLGRIADIQELENEAARVYTCQSLEEVSRLL